MKSERDEGSTLKAVSIREFFIVGLASVLAFAALATFRHKVSFLSEDATVYSLIAVWAFAWAFAYMYRRWLEAGTEVINQAKKLARYETKDTQRIQKSSDEYQARKQRIPCLGTWELDIVNNRLNWTDDVFAIFGLERKNGFLTYEQFLKRIHPTDRPVVEEAVSECLRERTPYAIDYRIVTPDGDVRIVFEQNQVVIENDRPVGIRGTIIDATEKMLSETDLRDQYGMLQFLIDAIPIPVFHKDKNGIFESCNKAYEEFFGVPQSDVIGNTVYDFLPENQAIEADNADKSLIRLGCSLTYEAKEINGIGETHDVIYYKTPLSETDGSPGGIIAAMLDISERKHMEAALRESEKRFRIIAESSSDWFWETDENHRFIYVSERYQEILGQTPESIFGRSRWDMAGDDDAEEIRDKWLLHITELNANKPFRDFIYLFKSGDGADRNVKISGIPVFDDAGVFRGYRGSGTDVTKHTQVEEALRKSEERHRNFAADVAHELRTPLAVLRTNLDNFDDSESVKSLRQDVDSMSRMVTQLLAATRIETYVAADSFLSVNLADVCRHVATLLGPIAIKEQRSIEVLGGDDPLVIQGIPESLEQAVRNLAENAIRYSSRNSVISLKLGRQGAVPYISVIDRGRGIPQEQREAIFERFLRADRRAGGAGLGLSIVKRTIENHSAEISIEDTPGGGATFIIRFPKSEGSFKAAE